MALSFCAALGVTAPLSDVHYSRGALERDQETQRRILDKSARFGNNPNRRVAPGEHHHMASYKLATYQSAAGPRAGLVIDDELFDAAKLSGHAAYASVLAILEDWRAARGVLRKAAGNAGKGRIKGLPLKRVKLLAPVQWPSAIYCAGANYAD